MAKAQGQQAMRDGNWLSTCLSSPVSCLLSRCRASYMESNVLSQSLRNHRAGRWSSAPGLAGALPSFQHEANREERALRLVVDSLTG